MTIGVVRSVPTGSVYTDLLVNRCITSIERLSVTIGPFSYISSFQVATSDGPEDTGYSDDRKDEDVDNKDEDDEDGKVPSMAINGEYRP